MNIHRRRSPGDQGSVLMTCLVITGVIGFVLASFLTLVRGQNMSTMRSLTWNATIPVAEAGLEEALTHLNRSGTNNLASNGWELSGGKYTVTRYLGDSYYTASITLQTYPIIDCTGFVPLPFSGSAGGLFAVAGLPEYTFEDNPSRTRYLSRTIRLRTRLDATFLKAMVARGQIDLRGNNIRTDSFDSFDPAYSTGGLYDPAKRKANGDVATNSGLINSLNVGTANIYGHVATGPGGSVSIGPNGAVGSLAWQSSGQKGIEPGHSTDDMNVSFPDVAQPFVTAVPPVSGAVDGTNYNFVLGTGDYLLSAFASQQTIYVTGNARLLVTDSFSLSGNNGIIRIAPGASLKLYVAAASASLGGNGVINENGNAERFAYYGLPSNTSLSFSGNAAFSGVIYAPNADFNLSGSGNVIYDFVGAAVTKTVTMNGHFNFHYDENLARVGPSRGYIVTSWDEL